MEYYKSIDTLPIYNYWQCVDKKDLTFLIISCPKSTPESTKLAKLSKAWESIESQMIELQLKDKTYIANLKKEARHYLKQAKAALTNNTLDRLHFKQSEIEREKESNGVGFNYNKSIAILEKYLGRHINDKEMTVSRYYIHYQMMVESMK